MQCPRDHSTLRSVARGSTTVDFCDTCKGTWFDKNEFSQAISESGGGQVVARQVKKIMQELIAQPDTFWEAASNASGIRCPRCGSGMKHVLFRSDGSEVTTDRCGGCQGYWFDAGEKGALFVFVQEKLDRARLLKIVGALFLILLVLAAGYALL